MFTTATSSTKQVSDNCVDYAVEQATIGTMWLHDNGFRTNRFTALDLFFESYADCQDGITTGIIWIAG